MKSAETAKPNELLKRDRELRQLSQADLALNLHLPDWRMVSRWERGISFPSYHYRRLLCKYFGKSAKELGLLPASDNFWNIPYPRNTLFTGREDILFLIHSLLKSDQTRWPLALSGMPGIGKTQIALEYAYRHREDYHAVFWIRAMSRETLNMDFTMIAALLNLNKSREEDQDAAISTVKEWLSSLNRWLLIFDDIENLHVLEDYLPISYQGHVLFTTHTQITGGLAEALVVPVLGGEEGTSFLLRRAKKLQQPSKDELMVAKEIVAAMGGLPLALDQVGAYVEQTGCNLNEYLELYQKYTATLLLERGDLVTGHPESIAITLQSVFEKVQQVNPQAMKLLHFLACLNLDTVPEKTITENFSILDPILAPITTNRLLLNAALKDLLQYSLIQREAGKIGIHPLVREEIKGNLKEEERHQWIALVEQIAGHLTPNGNTLANER